MNRAFSYISTFLALVLVYFLIQFVQGYYQLIQLPIANTITKILFWIGVSVSIIIIFGLLFFKKWIYSKRKKLLISLLTFLLGMVLIELTIRMVDNRPLKFSPHPYLNYIGTPYYISPDGLNIHNSLGFRGPDIEIPKPEGRYRIAILGGSSTYESFVKDWKKDFARDLERELSALLPDKDIEVVNAGLPGWDSWEDLINLQFRLLDLDLDLIIPYEGTNDVHSRLVRHDAYRADNTGSKKQWERKPCFSIRCLKIVTLITGYDGFSFDIISSTSARFSKKNDYNEVLQMTPMEALNKNPPIYFERNLRNIIAVAREHGINVLLSTWAWTDKYNDYAATDHYQMGFLQHNNVVKEVAVAKDVPVYDFASEMSKDKKYWGDGRHNNEEGVLLKSELFARYIISNNIITDAQEN